MGGGAGRVRETGGGGPAARPTKTELRSPRLYQNAFQNVAVDVMPEFVGEHRFDFLGCIIIQQSIGENDPPRAAQSGESGIRFFAFLRKLPAIDAAHARTRVLAQ